MKKILFTLLIFTLLLPPIGGAQEKKVDENGNVTSGKTLVIAPKPEEVKDYKALIKALPVKDERDVEDRKALTEFLMKFNPTDQYLYEELSRPRFVEIVGNKAVVDTYFVTLTAEAQKKADEEIKRISTRYGLEIVNRYDMGFTTMLYVKCKAAAAKLASEDLGVRMVEQDQILPEARRWIIKPQQKPDGAIKKDVRTNGDWALDLIDNRFGAYDNHYNSTNNAPSGRTYVLDGGVLDIPNHYNGRLSWIPASDYPYTNGDSHGTLVGALVASQIVGTAIEHNITSVRIPTGGNNAGAMIARIDSIKADALSNRPAYAQVNISIGYTTLDFSDGVIPSNLNTAIMGLLNADIPVICSTGQFNTAQESLPISHTNYWPQRVSGVIKVGMTSFQRGRLNFPNATAVCPIASNIQHISGSDIFAPGGIEWSGTTCLADGVLSVTNSGTLDSFLGTSVAAPIVSGVAAMYGSLQTTYYPKSWQMRDAIFSTATPSVVTNLNTADSNRFLYSMLPGNYCRNSASYAEGVARDSLVTCFGAYTDSQNAVRVRSREDPSFTESSGVIVGGNNFQTNFEMPSSNIDNGPVIVRSYQGSSVIGGYGFAYVDTVNPGVFTIDSTGTGYASAQAYFTDKVTLGQTIVNNSPSGWNWNPATHYLTIAVYGTGWRYRAGPNPGTPTNVQVRFFKNGNAVAGNPPSVSFAGAVGGYLGLDQVNADNPNAFLPGQGEVEMRVFVDGKEANRTKVRFN
jgi:uncharacterized protein (TIGR03437 family)